ncbi:calcyclin-binding protein [Erpetoichthys calabaricus]|uniref:Calcyclin-binding protein n=1 Tax=Erpetoichthys calabaricus TaxID=27687 RepID=A0A8C4SGH2_ERPCA|nr:calcyclin-binding protein [Erpetoichthys calabaricus]
MDIGEQILQLQNDLDEVKLLLEKVTRKRIRDILVSEQKKIETEISKKQQQQQKLLKEKEEMEKTLHSSVSKGYTVKINNYGWDQSDKFIKIYITLNGVHKIPAENVEATFSDRSFMVLIKDLDGKNHQMTVNNLLNSIDPQESYRKVKTDMVLVMCKKKTSKKWEFLTQVEKQAKEKQKPSLDADADADPSEGLMNVLKKIYAEGDDEMKRTINKAWAESRDKQSKGEEMEF